MVEEMISELREQTDHTSDLHVVLGKDLTEPDTKLIKIYFVPQSARKAKFFQSLEKRLGDISKTSRGQLEFSLFIAQAMY